LIRNDLKKCAKDHLSGSAHDENRQSNLIGFPPCGNDMKAAQRLDNSARRRHNELIKCARFDAHYSIEIRVFSAMTECAIK